MLKPILQHLRFPFSILLLPVFLFALSESNIPSSNYTNTSILFLILHFLVYPSSNAYNSLQDHDQGSIGLIKNPLPAPTSLNFVTILFDISAILLGIYLNFYTGLGVAIYILFSRLYSYRKIRLKKYPVTGFLVVFIFQGFWIFMLTQFTTNGFVNYSLFPLAICASCLIGAVYPLSQIYQHKQDKEDGVVSISYLLGYRGTFIFSGILFLIGTSLFLVSKMEEGNSKAMFVFLGCQIPVVLFFLFWFLKVWKNVTQANYTNTMRMNILSSVCMNLCFFILSYFKL